MSKYNTLLKQYLKRYGSAFLPALKKWWKDKHADDAAALAFYSLISLVPLLIISVYIASLAINEETVKRIIISETDRVAGQSIGLYIAGMLHSDVTWTGSNFSPLLGALLIIFSATKMISELRHSLSKVFGKPDKKPKAYASLVTRLVSFTLVLLLGGIVISAVVVEMIVNLVMGALPEQSILSNIVSRITPLTSFVGVILLSTFTMRWLPAKKPNLKDAFAGGVVCATLLIVLKVAITQTIKHSDIGSYYGNAFTLVLVLFWVYFTMQVFLYGAEYAAEIGRQTKSQPQKEELTKPDEPTKPTPERRDPFLS